MNDRWARLGGLLGIVYCIAGVVLIFLGWNGAASNDRSQAQMPYIVSGGIGGLALVVIGAALIVAQSLRTDRVELRGGIDDLRQAVERMSAAGPAATQAAMAGSAGGGATASASDAVIAGPNSYHRATCRLVQGHPDATIMQLDEARASGRAACRICNPDGATLTAAS